MAGKHATPSCTRACAASSDTSGSSRTRILSALCTWTTCDPRRAKHWASSQPIRTTTKHNHALRHSIILRPGHPRGCRWSDSRTSSIPGRGGTRGRAPAAIIIDLVVSLFFSSPSSCTSTVHGSIILHSPAGPPLREQYNVRRCRGELRR